MASYDRYKSFRTKDGVGIVPFIEIPVKDTDIEEVYHAGSTRLDILSYEYYGDPNYGWLILQANPQYGSIEFDIPDESVIRIPFPLGESLRSYNEGIDKYNKLY